MLEICRRCGMSDYADLLMSYPNYAGTIQSFTPFGRGFPLKIIVMDLLLLPIQL